MEIVALIVMASLMPVMTITAFVIGYNVNAEKKILRLKKKKAKPTEEEKMLERIDKAKVY